MTMLVGIMFGAMAFGVIGAGLIMLNYILGKKKQEDAIREIKATVIPEVESMTKRILIDSMDLVMDKSIEMTKKMMASQYED